MIIMFEGRIGQGKTLTMSIFAYYLKNRLRNRKQIYANYSLKGSKKILDLKQLDNIKDGIVCLDEMHNQFDSREYKDQKNIKTMRRFIDYLRKNGNILLGTTQTLNKIDKRIRQSVVLLGMCQKIEKNHHKLMLGEYIETDIASKLFGIKIYDLHNIDLFYGLYDTLEPINRLE